MTLKSQQALSAVSLAASYWHMPLRHTLSISLMFFFVLVCIMGMCAGHLAIIKLSHLQDSPTSQACVQNLPGGLVPRRGGEQRGDISGARRRPSQRCHDYCVHAVRHRGDPRADSATGWPPGPSQCWQPAHVHPAGTAAPHACKLLPTCMQNSLDGAKHIHHHSL